MLKGIFWSFLFILLHRGSFGSEPDSSQRSFAGIKPVLSILNEAGFYYEHKFRDRLYIGGGLSRVYRNYPFAWLPVGMMGSPILLYDGVSLTATIKKGRVQEVATERDLKYRGLLINYKYKQFEYTWINQGGMGGSDYASSLLISKYKTTVLIQYLIGTKSNWKWFSADMYCGIGMRMFVSKTNYIAEKFNKSLYLKSDYEPYSKKFIFPMPAITVGVLVGLNW